MNVDTKREIRLYCTMSLIGGLFAMYSLLEHANVFGGAETSNMILLVTDLLCWDTFHILIRLGSLLVYASGIITTIWMSKHHPDIQKRVCIIIDCFAALILGLLPEDLHPVVALYPMAFAISIQWCTFRGIRDNPCATTFSTGNFRQLVTLGFYSITERTREYLPRIGFYLLIMLSFHAGIAVIYLIWPVIPHHSIWIVYIPLACALIQELRISGSRQKFSDDALPQNSGCDDI